MNSSSSKYLRAAAWVLLVLAVGLGGCSGGGDDGTQYWCPMCPQFGKHPSEGMCGICSMALVPFTGNAAAESGVLALTDRQIQQAGVRLGRAEVRDLVREIDTTGRLEVNPANKRTMTMQFPDKSRVERMLVHFAGEQITEGKVLAEFANKTMSGWLKEYRVVMKEMPILHREGKLEEKDELLAQSKVLRKKLDLEGLPNFYIDNVAVNPRYLFTEVMYPIVAPVTGTLLADPVFSEGMTVPQGAVLFHIADLESLWLTVDLYEHERPLAKVGQAVEFTTQAVPDRSFDTVIQVIDPVVQPRTQTVRARCTVLNLDGDLAPGMFVRVRILSQVPKALSVPESAVLHSGRRDVVLVAEGGGRFRPKIVQLGRRHLSTSPAGGEAQPFGAEDERFHEVVSGLNAGDRVVVAGAFLLNAEANFQGILKKMFDAADLAERAPQLPDPLKAELDGILDVYFAVGTALLEDDADGLPALGGDLHRRATVFQGPAAAVDPRYGSLAEAALGLASFLQISPVDLHKARVHYGTLSREVVGYLRDFAPDRVAGGELFLFRCPMADDFGFDLWVQNEDGIANPYMGQRMPTCGSSADLN